VAFFFKKVQFFPIFPNFSRKKLNFLRKSSIFLKKSQKNLSFFLKKLKKMSKNKKS